MIAPRGYKVEQPKFTIRATLSPPGIVHDFDTEGIRKTLRQIEALIHKGYNPITLDKKDPNDDSK